MFKWKPFLKSLSFSQNGLLVIGYCSPHTHTYTQYPTKPNALQLTHGDDRNSPLLLLELSLLKGGCDY